MLLSVSVRKTAIRGKEKLQTMRIVFLTARTPHFGSSQGRNQFQVAYNNKCLMPQGNSRVVLIEFYLAGVLKTIFI